MWWNVISISFTVVVVTILMVSLVKKADEPSWFEEVSGQLLQLQESEPELTVKEQQKRMMGFY